MVNVLNKPLSTVQVGGSHHQPQQLLCEALQAMGGDPPSAMPWLIRLIENPDSPVALPGKIDLYSHDCLHLLLDRGFSSYDEAFIIGFTMGNHANTNWLHLTVFKLVSRFLYPTPYRFNTKHLRAFDLGVLYGKAVPAKNLSEVDFKAYQDLTIRALRAQFGITWETLQTLQQAESILTA